MAEDAAPTPVSPLPFRRARGALIFLLKLAVAAAIIGWLWRSDKLRPGELAAAWRDHPGYVWAGLLILLSLPLLTAVRWWCLLRCQGIDLSIGRAVSITWIGLLFTLLPGSLVAGDVVKAVLVVRDSSRRAAAATSVYIDRAVGLFSLLIIGAACGLLSWNDFDRLAERAAAARTLVVISSAAAAVGLACAAVMLSRHFGENPLVRWVESRGGEDRKGFAARTFRILHRVISSIHAYRHHKGMLAAVAAISVASQVLSIIVAVAFGRALGVFEGTAGPAMELKPYFVGFPLAMIANAIPFAPGGLGQMEAALGYLFHLFGSEKGANLALLWHVGVYLTFLWGILFYLQHSRKGPGPQPGSPGASSGMNSFIP